MFHDCKCSGGPKRLLTVTKKNIGDLDRWNDACHRRWAKNFCDRVSDAFSSGGKEMAGDAWDELLEDKFGEEHAKIVDDMTRKGLQGPLDEFEKWWDDGVKEGFNCDRFLGKDGAQQETEKGTGSRAFQFSICSAFVVFCFPSPVRTPI